MPLGCAYPNGICSTLENSTLVNRLNERDLSYHASSAALFISGIDLNSAIFDKYGYVMNSSTIVKEVLDAGLRRMHLDVYWDTLSNTWTLCPTRPPPKWKVPSNTTSQINSPTLQNSNETLAFNAIHTESSYSSSRDDYEKYSKRAGNPSGQLWNTVRNETNSSSEIDTTTLPHCDDKFNFNVLIEAIHDYVENSDSNIAASLLYLHLRPKILPVGNVTITDQDQKITNGVQSLNKTIGTSGLSSRIMTPGQIRNQEERSKLTRSGVYHNLPKYELWPDLQTALTSNENRIVISYNDTLSSTVKDLNNLRSIAFAAIPTIENPAKYSIEDLSKMNFTDTYVSDFKGWKEARKLGVAPVLKNSSFEFYSDEMWELLNYHGYWAWEQGDPILYSIRQRQSMLKNGHIRQSDLDACAVFTPDGFNVADCNMHYPILCVSNTNTFDWVFSDGNETYFDSNCPSGYSFGVPTTPLEARYLRKYMLNSDKNMSWVDFNSLFLPNCWVTGGTNAVCPYNIQEYSRNGIGYIAVSSAVAFFGFLFIWLFEWDRGRSPLMKKTFKRVASKEEFEGIPS